MNRTTRIAGLLLALTLVLTSVLGAGTISAVQAAELRQDTDQPAEPEQQPEQPTEPAPEEPAPPTEAAPEEPAAPQEPAQPEAPAQPEQPIAPIEPVEPVPPIALLPAIAINIPTQGEVTSPVEVVVVGTGQGLPENNVVVQAKDANGTVLDGQPTTVQADLGGAGEWRVTLRPNVEPGTLGTIEAFSQSPADGSIVASASVNVTYGTAQATPEPTPEPTEPPPAQPFINIRIPVNGEMVSPTEIVVVGDGVSLPENNVVVQALDSAGVLLGETATTVAAPLGGEGEWRAILRPDVDPGTEGSIVAFSDSPATGERLAIDSIAVAFGSAAPEPTATPAPTPVNSFIQIDVPVDGETTSNQEVVVVGRGAGLPENNVVVQALDASGRVLDTRATTVDADLGGEGEWRVSVYPNVAPGTQGRIVAQSTSPANGQVIARDEVFVTYGQFAPAPHITIVEPRNGSILRTDRPIAVTGSAQNVFENNVVVRVVASNGAVLAEKPTTVDERGSWAVDLNVPQVNAYARIVAYSPSPVDGSTMAYDQVDVQLVGPQPTPPPSAHIKISSPSNNSIVNTTHGFTVFGTASGVSDNNVTVRVLDDDGRILRQITTIVDANGAWNVIVNLLIANGTQGGIYAFSTSPQNGSVEAEDSVNVTFSSACRVRTDWPVYIVERGDTLFSIAQRTGSTVGELVLANCITNPNLITVGEELRVPRLPSEDEAVVPPQIDILNPEADAVLDIQRPVVFDGDAAGLSEGNVMVRVLDNLGVVLDERRVTVTQPTDANGTWLWEVDLDLFRAIPGSRGTVLAYAQSPSDGTIVVADTRSVIFGVDLDQPWIAIDTPIPYAQVARDGVVSVSGRGGGLFENNVVIEAQDDVGNVLFVAPTTATTEEVGGSGPWELSFALDYVGRGAIVAYSPSPVDGSRMAEARQDVYFGNPQTLDEFVVVTFPLPNTIVTGASPVLSAAGYAGGVDPDSLRIVVMDANSRIILSLPALVDPATGLWTVHLAGPLSVDRDQMATIHAIAGTGSVAAADVVPIQVEQPAVTGEVTYLQRIALPPDAVVRVMLQNTSIADAPPEVTLLGEQFITNPGQVPIPFAVKYNPADVDPRSNYGLRVRIEDSAGTLLFMNTQSVPVLTQDNPSRGVEVIVEPMP